MHKDFEKFNPFRSPRWRFDRVLTLLDKKSGPGSRTSWKKDDEFIKTARVFLRNYRSAKPDTYERESLFSENPGLYYANQIFEAEDEELRGVIEARILARQTDEEIADKICTLPSAVAWYEALFFNVRDRISNKDWVVRTIIGQEMLEHGVSSRIFHTTAKMFAYFTGPLVLDLILDGFNVDGFVTDRSEVAKYLDKHFEGGMRRRSAMSVNSFEVNKFNVMQVFETHARLMELEKTHQESGSDKSDYEKNVMLALGSISWGAGTAGRQKMAGSPILAFDSSAAELRADEMLQLEAGETLDYLADVKEQVLVPPPKG